MNYKLHILYAFLGVYTLLSFSSDSKFYPYNFQDFDDEFCRYASSPISWVNEEIKRVNGKNIYSPYHPDRPKVLRFSCRNKFSNCYLEESNNISGKLIRYKVNKRWNSGHGNNRSVSFECIFCDDDTDGSRVLFVFYYTYDKKVYKLEKHYNRESMDYLNVSSWEPKYH